ncbi:MAG: type IV pilus modification PilV family protein [Planctomycetota bacterium]|jgi:prepilin-type N-terminal cleavage/methylation domain-containing protein
MVWTKRNKRGFTLVETLTASAILSGAVLTLVAITTRSLTETRLNRHYEIAASIINRQLSLLDYTGIDEFIELGRADGVVEDFEPGYHWEVTTEYQGIDSLYLVTITVTWTERNRPYSVSVDTMLNGESIYVGTGIGQE